MEGVCVVCGDVSVDALDFIAAGLTGAQRRFLLEAWQSDCGGEIGLVRVGDGSDDRVVGALLRGGPPSLVVEEGVFRYLSPLGAAVSERLAGDAERWGLVGVFGGVAG